MRKILILALAIIVSVCFPLSAEKFTASTLTISSMVGGLGNTNPRVIVGLSSSELSYFVSPEADTTYITGLDLQNDGSFSFALITSQEVVVSEGSKASSMAIEIKAEGFNLYDYNYTGILEGSSMDELNIKQRNAVPLVSTSPEISISQFSGQNENVSVNYVSGNRNKIEVVFKQGVTRSDLVLGTFSVEWKGKRPLDVGIYKAKVSVTYSKE